MFPSLRTASKDLRLKSRYIPTNARCYSLKADMSAVYLYETRKDETVKYYAIAYRGTAGRPEFHVSYHSDERRMADVQRFFESVQQHHARRQTQRAEKSAWVNPLTVGTILYTSWGYDQTNVDFFAVTKVSGRRVWIRKIACEYEATGFMAGKCWPSMPIRFLDEKPLDPEHPGDAWTRLLRGHETMHVAQPLGKDVYVKVSDSIHAWPEQGRTHYTSSYA